MMFVSGRVTKLKRNHNGQLRGLQLQNGWDIRFTEELGELASSLVTEGSAMGIEGLLRCDELLGTYLQASKITNLDSRQSATLPALKHKGKPGMQLDNTPVNTASLAPTETREGLSGASDLGEEVSSETEWSPSESGSPDAESKSQDGGLRPGSFLQSLLKERDSEETNWARSDSARSIGVAYDSLHRIQAILAYLHIMKHRVPGIGQFLDESKHTYLQGLSRFAAGDYASAKEFAEASACLSRIVEILIARTLRSDSTLPSLVPPPPENFGATLEPDHLEEDLVHAESVLARIHWVLEHGTLPTEDRAQVRKITAWGDAFYRQARSTYRNAVLEDACEFAKAALAGAHSAEHVCRKWYVHGRVEH
jgi:hypothetical protein